MVTSNRTNQYSFIFCSLSESNLLEAAIVLEEFCKVRSFLILSIFNTKNVMVFYKLDSVEVRK